MSNLKIYHIGLCATPGTNNGMQKAFKNHSYYREIYTGEKDLNNKIIRDVKEFNPDVVFMQVQTPNTVHLSTIESIRHYCKYIVNFTGDVRSPLPTWYIETGKLIDLTLFVSNTDVIKARNMGINANWIQIGFDPEIFNHEVKPKHIADIIFTANNYNMFPLSQERRDIAYALKEEFKDKFQLFGNGWPILTINSNPSMDEQAANLRGCKIAISHSNFNHSKYISDRVLRIMGAGAFCLSHRFDDYQELYQEGKEITTYASTIDMISKCKYYLENETERNAIAKNGYELTHNLYTWDSFVKNIIKICEL